MSAARGVVEIELKADRFTGPARQAQNDFQQLENRGTRSLKSIEQSSRQASSGLQGMGTQGTAAMNNLNAATKRTSASMQQTAASLNASRVATIGMTGSIAGMAASFVSLETSLTNMPKRLNAITKAEVNLARGEDLVANKTLRLKALTIRLEKDRAKGKKTAEEMAVTEQKLINTRQELQTATTDLAAKQEDLNLKNADYLDTLKLFGTSVATTFLTAGSSIAIMLTTMATTAGVTTGEFVRLKLAALSTSKMFKILRIDLHAAKLAFKGYSASAVVGGTASAVAATGVHRLAFAVKGLYLSLGPIGWAIIGITAAFEIWTYNVGGVQQGVRWLLQELAKLWEYLKWIIPVVGAVDEAFKLWDPEGHANAAAGLSDAIAGIGAEAEDLTATTTDTDAALQELLATDLELNDAVNESSIAITGLNAALGGTMEALPPLQKAIMSFNEQLYRKDAMAEHLSMHNDIITTLKNASKEFNLLSINGQAAMREMTPVIRDLVNDMTEVGNHDMVDSLLSELSKLPGIGADYVKQFRKEIRGASADMDNLSKKNYNLSSDKSGSGRGSGGSGGGGGGGGRPKLPPGQRYTTGGTRGVAVGFGGRPPPGWSGGVTSTSRTASESYRMGPGGKLYRTSGGANVSRMVSRRKSRSNAKKRARRREKAFLASDYGQALTGYNEYFGEDEERLGTKYKGSPTLQKYYEQKHINHLQSQLNKFREQLSDFPVAADFSEGTRKEALIEAYKESLDVENLFNEINSTDPELASGIRGKGLAAARRHIITVRERRAEAARRAEQARILSYARPLGGTPEIIQTVIEFLKTPEGEWHLQNQIDYLGRQRHDEDEILLEASIS